MGIQNKALSGTGQRVPRWIEGVEQVDGHLRAIFDHEEAGGRARLEGRERAKRLWAWFREDMRRRPFDDRPWEEAVWRIHACLAESLQAAASCHAAAVRLQAELDQWLNGHPEIMEGADFRAMRHGFLFIDDRAGRIIRSIAGEWGEEAGRRIAAVLRAMPSGPSLTSESPVPSPQSLRSCALKPPGLFEHAPARRRSRLPGGMNRPEDRLQLIVLDPRRLADGRSVRLRHVEVRRRARAVETGDRPRRVLAVVEELGA